MLNRVCLSRLPLGLVACKFCQALLCIEIVIASLLLHQDPVATGLNDLAPLDDQDSIGALDGRQAMGDHYADATL